MTELEFGTNAKLGARMFVPVIPLALLVVFKYLFRDRVSEVVLWSALCAVFVVAAVLDWRARTVVTEDGISFFHLAHGWQLRPVRIPWTEVTSIEVGKHDKWWYPIVHLTNGAELWVRYPSSSDGQRQFAEAVAAMEQRHSKACGGVQPGQNASDPEDEEAANLAYDRLSAGFRSSRRRQRALVVGSVATGALTCMTFLGVTWASSGYHPAPEVRACAVVPSEAAQRAMPGVAAKDWSLGICRWETAKSGELRLLQVAIDNQGADEAAESYGRDRRQHEVEHIVHPVPGVGKRAHSWGRIEPSRYVGEAWSYVSGYIVKVELHTLDAAAEQRAVEILRATVGNLRQGK